MDNIKSLRDKSFITSFYLRNQMSRTKLNMLFIPGLIFTLIISIFSYKQVQEVIRANKWVSHTEEVIQKVDASLYSIIDIESGQRAYLITGDKDFLVDMEESKKKLQNNIDDLIELTKDNPSQSDRSQNLAVLSQKRIIALSEIANLKQANQFDTTEGMQLFKKNQTISNQLKSLAEEMKAVEDVLLDERTAIALKRNNIAKFILLTGSLISLSLLLAALFLINSELERRNKAEERNQKNKLRLTGIIESAGDMIAAFDNEQRFIAFNRAYQREFKYLFGKSIHLGMSLDAALKDCPEVKIQLSQEWKGSFSSNELNKKIEVKEGEQINFYEITYGLIHNNENEVDGMVQVIRNITKREEEHQELQRSYTTLAHGMTELENKNQQITLLVEMSDIMLACASQDELSLVMQKFASKMLNFASGFLYIMHPSKNYLEKAATWHEPTPQDLTFNPEDCWAIRRGRVHETSSSEEELCCPHIHTTPNKAKLLQVCMPLMAQNDIYGLLYLELKKENQNHLSENQTLVINAFAELTALALANVRLRENLRYQSIRDPLTGLYNRRYLEDFLFKQIHQSERTKEPLALLMLDLDHFKKINDTYGHDAGDLALKNLGRILQTDIQANDLAARYGGEEFIVIFYNTNLELAKTRAEKIREAVSLLQIKYGAEQVGPLTISIGIAQYPLDGTTSQQIIDAADEALYLAKNSGRNKLVSFSEMNKTIN